MLYKIASYLVTLAKMSPGTLGPARRALLRAALYEQPSDPLRCFVTPLEFQSKAEPLAGQPIHLDHLLWVSRIDKGGTRRRYRRRCCLGDGGSAPLVVDRQDRHVVLLAVAVDAHHRDELARGRPRRLHLHRSQEEEPEDRFLAVGRALT